MYHGVDRVAPDADPHGLFVTPENFRAQVEWMLEAGFVPISEDDYLAARAGRRALPRRAVLITFDDGYAGLANHAAPTLRSLGLPSVLYVPVGLLGGRTTWLPDGHRHALLSATDLRDLHAGGMAIGSHGCDHADLTTVTEGDLRRQTADTRAVLAGILGDRVRTFAFPYGYHDARAREAVRDAGYDAAFAVHDPAGRFAIQRVDINATDTLRTFRIKLHGLYPAVRRSSRHAPRLRRLAHDIVGREPRSADGHAPPGQVGAGRRSR
ncbi:MAG TPA: polysaccharide deacetylase family protein [Nocardioides sp.]|nr:polysaccharide deacetylase family protein [Nocardioides sp.]